MSRKTKIIKPQAGFQEQFVRTNVDFVVGGGVLNPQPIDSLVLTPYGFKRMGEIKIGDVVCDIHGDTQIVRMVLDKGMNECVEFTLDDGRKVESSLNHHWMVVERHGKILNITAKEIIDYMDSRANYDSKHKNPYRIPNTGAVYFEDLYKKERTIDPYVLGCLLGDGWFSENKFYVGFCAIDDFIVNRIRELGYNIKKEYKDEENIKYEIRNKELKQYVKDLGLLGHHAHEKFIPRSYKYAPKEVRLEILRGLLDTDGYSIKSPKNRYVCGYRTSSKQLSEDVQWIINSLGGKCYIFKTDATIRKRSKDSELTMNCKDSYGFRIQMPNNKDLFHLPRKKDVAQSNDERKVKPYLSIKSYKLIGKKHTKCIQVSGEEHLYLTDGFVITRNCGKAQPLDCKIFTPYGTVTMGDLKIGDTICDTDGGTQMVLNIYEKGLLDSYKITFDDGTSTRCCYEHLWDVFDMKTRNTSTITLREIMNNGIDRYRFPLCKPNKFIDKALPIDPYFLGVILGDGHILKNTNSSITIATDEEIIQRAFIRNEFSYSKHVPCNRATYFTITDKYIRKKIIDLGLMGTLSDTKFVPKDYLYSSIEQRTELLRGLFDTDGYNDKNSNRIEYTTTSEQLCKDVCFLVRSLGGKASVGTKIGHYRDENGDKVICKKAYRIQCRFDERNNFITLQRKKVYKDKSRDINKKLISVEYIGKEEMRCILVSNPNHLYLTDDFIVTHNTFAAVLAMGEPAKDPKFRALFLRNNLGDVKAGGGIIDTFREVYGDAIDITTSGDPLTVTFKESGAVIDITHTNDQSVPVLDRRFKGRQYDAIYFDEGTGFTWDCFTTIISRNRGVSGWAGHILMTTNPEREHWLRTFLDWYIGNDGFIREDRAGVVRYFYILGETVKDIVWGDTKEEVYEKCKIDINRKIEKIFGEGTPIRDKWRNMIKSFTFYLGRMSENKASMCNNENYIGTIAMAGGVEAQKKLEGNWNVSKKDGENVTISLEDATTCFLQEPRRNGDLWITCDLADTGTDNCLALAWDGFHVTDIMILKHSTPRENAEMLQEFARKNHVVDTHIIYDAIRGRYINDYIPFAVPYESYRATLGMYGRYYAKLKDECYARLVEVIKNGHLSFEEEISHMVYEHQLNKEGVLVETEFIEECSVVKFTDALNGKKRLLTKKEMNRELGKGRSMDLLDPCAMRMLPVLKYVYGDELIKSAVLKRERDDFEDTIGGDIDIYDETNFGIKY